MSDAIWQSERRLWLEGTSAFVELLHSECIVVFGEPIGIMKGDVITESIKNAPRWTQLEMRDRCTSSQGDDTIVIAYRADAQRGSSAPYRAYRSSTYVRCDRAWRLIQHQQTPAS